MKTSQKIRVLVSAAFLSITFAGAVSQPLLAAESIKYRSAEKYPCNVFSYTFCFRAPEETEMRLGNGPDFTIYELSDAGGNAILSVYEGTAPSKQPANSKGLKEFRSGSIRVIAYTYTESSGAEALELRFHYKRGVWVHIFGANDRRSRAYMLELLSTFRSCEKTGFTSMRCESKAIVPPDVLVIWQAIGPDSEVQ